MTDADIAIVGAGAAGLSLALRLTEGPGETPSVVLLDAPRGPLRPVERTWCFWEQERGDLDSLVSASWERMRVHERDGRVTEGALHPLRYKMIRSTDFEAAVGARLAERENVRRLTATVEEVRDTDGPGGAGGPEGAVRPEGAGGPGAEIRGTGEDGTPLGLRARWAFDSRPLPRLPPARTTLLQHFRGWFVRTGRPAFDPRTAVLMDFRTPQPPPGAGLSFGYVMPLGPHEALVEYTVFSAEALTTAEYDRELRHYTRDVLALGPLEVLAAEQGVIPMTDAVFPRRAGRSVFRIGTAGGATRPSTGYTFATVQRQSRAIAAAWRAGRPPLPPPPHPARARAMDAVLLRALATGRIDGADFFGGLFRRNPMERLLRFLDGRSGPWDELRLGLNTPVLPMLRSAAELPLLPRHPLRSPSCHR